MYWVVQERFLPAILDRLGAVSQAHSFLLLAKISSTYFVYIAFHIVSISEDLPSTLPTISSRSCMQLRRDKGAEWWDQRLDEDENTEEVEAFVTTKLDDPEAYDVAKNEVDNYKVLLDNKEMELVRIVSALLGSD